MIIKKIIINAIKSAIETVEEEMELEEAEKSWKESEDKESWREMFWKVSQILNMPGSPGAHDVLKEVAITWDRMQRMRTALLNIDNITTDSEITGICLKALSY